MDEELFDVIPDYQAVADQHNNNLSNTDWRAPLEYRSGLIWRPHIQRAGARGIVYAGLRP